MLAKAECETALKRFLEEDNFSVLKYELTPLELHGFNSDYLQLNVLESRHDNQPQKKSNFVVKKLNVTPDTKMSLMHEITAQTWLKNVNVTPRMYWRDDDNLVVFEDFISKGYVLPTNCNNLDIEHIRIALETLAKFHVAGIKNNNCKIENTTKDVWYESGINLLSNLWEYLHENALHQKDLKNKLKNLYENSIKLLETIKTSQSVVCHGYMWGNNVLFVYENGKPKQCTFINLELQHTNFAACDVLHFIYRSTTPKTRQSQFHKLLKFYCDCVLKEKRSPNSEGIIFTENFKTSVGFLAPIIKLENICYRLIEKEPFLASSFNMKLATEALKKDQNLTVLLTESLTELNDLFNRCSLTREDYYKIVENAVGTSDYKLLEYNTRPLGEMGGFLGDHNKLTISVCLENHITELHLFSKFMPKAESALNMALDIGAFSKEIFIYKNFIPTLHSLGVDLSLEYAVPCYFVRDNDVLVFKDLEYSGYRTLNPRDTFSFEFLTMAVKRLAKFHASSIIYEEKMSETLGSRYNLNQHYHKELQESMYCDTKNHYGTKCAQAGMRAVDLLLKLFPAEKALLEDDRVLEKIKTAFKKINNLVKESTEFRNVICHGDLWNNNILMQFVDNVLTDCRFIDFQLTRYCPPAHDILNLIYLTTTRSLRAKHFYDIVNVYYQELKCTLHSYDYDVDVLYPYTDLIKSIQALKPQAICQTCIYLQLVLIDQDIFKDFMVNEEVLSNVFTNDRKDYIMVLYEKDPIFRSRMAEAIQDLREMCVEYF